MQAKHVNSFLIAFSFFQFGILLPIVAVWQSQLIIVISTMLIFIIGLVFNKFKIKKYVLLATIVLVSVFFLNYLLYQNTNTLIIFMEFVGKSFLLFFFGSFDFDKKELEKNFANLSVLNFFSVVLVFALGFEVEIGYMRFGYAILPTVLMSLYVLLTRKLPLYKRMVWFVLLLAGFLLMLFYGNRGTLICLAIFVLGIFFTLRINRSIRVLIMAITGLVAYLAIYQGLLSKIIDFIYEDLSIKTYSLQKFRLALEVGLLESSSGRDQIYREILELFQQNPVWGMGIGITQTEIGFTAHNFFLQVLSETGIMGLSVWIIFLGIALFMLKEIKNIDYKLFMLLFLVFSVSFGRLLISSDIWLRSEWWLFLSLLFNSYFMLRKSE